jgi:hypothetical protein
VRVYQFRHTGMRRHLYPKAGAPGKKKISGPGGLASASKIGQLLPVVEARRRGCDGADFGLEDDPA